MTVGVKSGDVADLIAVGQPVKVEHHTVEALVSTDPDGAEWVLAGDAAGLGQASPLDGAAAWPLARFHRANTEGPNMTASPTTILAGRRRTAQSQTRASEPSPTLAHTMSPVRS